MNLDLPDNSIKRGFYLAPIKKYFFFTRGGIISYKIGKSGKSGR